ncbi:tetratricopeptide repeat protein [Bizionia argentinensis JUB59]|uniref:Tetratricopeptide repeat protein n=1 Tax=Bizionia argentinensis JUB59 TaxID=1046627 RepID=G2ECK0_9FLAO|nr:tetratricopeptide repeat protein [Bizionia argentinensis]EGV43827.1 tetratricopeptide repeat protein [Bizionia argentinensis JUB59]
MIHFQKTYFLSLVVAFLSVCSFAQNTSLFEQGNTLYNDGKYEEAINSYQQVLDTDMHSAELYFNLANAHYKLNHIAPSIFYYEKAQHLAPNDPDIKQNMAFAQNMTLDAVDVVPEVGISKVINQVSHVVSFEAWAIMTIGFVFLAVFAFINYYMSFGTRTKRFSFTFGSVFMILMIGCLVSAFNKYDLDKSDNPAIVFAQESQIKSEPNLRSTEAFVLHEGTKVQVLDTVEDWKKIKLTDGKEGWIRSGDIKLLNNF